MVISRRCFTKDGREKYQNEKCTSEACRNHYFFSIDMQICDVLVPLPYSFIRELKEATSVFEPRTKTGIKYFASCQDGGLSQISKLTVSINEEILKNINVVQSV